MIETEDQLSEHISQPFDALAMDALSRPMEASEIIISTFPKGGTTWAGQIAHGLRSKGDESFSNLSQVFPWLEMGHVFGHNLSTPQKFSPHLFKSHMHLSELPQGGKVINVIRNPGDTLISYYNFWSGVLFDAEKISLEMMARQFFLLDRSNGPRNMFRLNYFQHLIDFHSANYDGKVLYLAYEDMKADLSASVVRIAEFMEIDLNTSLHKTVVEHASFDYMLGSKEKFQESVPSGTLEMVATGRVGDSTHGLSADLQLNLEAAWSSYVTPQLGYQNYKELRDSISLV